MSGAGRAGRGAPPPPAPTVGRGRGRPVPQPVVPESVPGVAPPAVSPDVPGARPPSGESGDHGTFKDQVLSKSPHSSSPSSTSPQSSPSRSPMAAAIERLQEIRVADPGETGSEPPPIEKMYGTEGAPVNVAVNYVRVLFGEQAGPFLYFVRFQPVIESIDVMRTIMLRSPAIHAVTGQTMSFTGNNLYLPIALSQDKTEIDVPHPSKPEETVKVSIVFVKKPPHDELIPFFNTLLRRVMRCLKLVQIKFQYYMPDERIQVPQHKLEIWPGLVNKIVELDGGLLLLCDVSHKVLRTTTAYQLLKETLEKSRRSGSSVDFKKEVHRNLVGCVVLTMYNNKPYRIDDVDFTQNPMSTFERGDGTSITYKDYFKNQWNKEVTDLKQPLLIHKPKPRKGEEETRIVALVPELCFMTGLTDDIRSDFRAMRDIASHTRIRPEVRYQKLMQFLNNVQKNEEAKKIFNDWKLSLDTRPMTTRARYFPQEKLIFNNREVAVREDVSWSREATGTNLYNVINCDKWIVICCKREEGKLIELVACLKEVTKSMGFTFGDPQKITFQEDSPVAYVNAIRSNVIPNDTKLVLIMTPGAGQREDRYNAIKKVCCCELAVPSQVIRFATFNDQKKARSVAQKVALQIQCKLGGTPWVMKIPFKAAMFVGIDTYHDPLKQGRSCLAIVSSTNPDCSKWYSKVFFQGPQEEIGQILQQAIVASMNKYQSTCNLTPDRVFLYRDGVGDGSMQAVSDYEVPQIDCALNNYVGQEGAKPMLTVIVVQKRINLRMLAQRGNSFDNPKSGTVLDKDVTRCNFHDFFLVSQHVTQGTVTPTHYVMLRDDGKMPFDRIQRLTYRMTHLYYNWPGCVRVPAPCQYAHKIAYLAGENLKAEPKEEISDKLFFL